MALFMAYVGTKSRNAAIKDVFNGWLSKQT